MAAISLRGVSSAMTDEGFAVRGVDLDVPDGVVCALIGPSGSGKTTLLRLVAGLEPLAAGEVWFGGQEASAWPPGRRNLGYCPQQNPLYPYLDVADNISFGLKLRRMVRADRDERVHAEARAAGIEDLLHRMPSTLSAGERQVAGLARARVRMPGAFLLDEPLAGIDVHQRARLRADLARVFHTMEVPVLLATNDQTEALALGDHLAVLHEGRLVQHGTPRAVHDRPDGVFVASFVGNPGMNVVAGVLEAGRRTTFVRVGEGAVALTGVPVPLRTRLDGRPVLLGIRPEHIDLGGADAALAATIERVEALGATSIVHARVAGAGTTLAVRVSAPGRLTRGQRVGLEPSGRRAHLFDPVTGTALWHAAA